MDTHIESRSLPWGAAGRVRGGRPTQQDELVCLHDPMADTRLLVLADGMGGDGAGELASAGVVAVARRQWEDGAWREQAGALFLETLCQEAHIELRRRGADLAHGEPHSTIVALLMRGDQVYWAHVGDSRLYRFHRQRLLDCTEDHSVAQLKIRRGLLAPDQCATDPDQHKLLRGLGGSQPPRVDHGGCTLHAGQAFVLCSDGVWEHLSTQELGDFAQRGDPHAAVCEALALVAARGGADGDNAALILVRSDRRGWLQRFAARTGTSWLGGTAPRRAENTG